MVFLFNFLIAFGLWFNHFEFVGHVRHKETAFGYYMWLLSFYVEAMVVAAIGSVIYLNYKLFSAENLILLTAVFFAAIILHFTINKKTVNPNCHVDTTNTVIYMVASLGLLVLAWFVNVQIIEIILYITALYVPVVAGVFHWIRG